MNMNSHYQQETTNLIGTRLGQKIRKLREEKNMTQQELAKKARVSATYVSKIESGSLSPKIGPSEKVIRRLTRALADNAATSQRLYEEVMFLAGRIPERLKEAIILSGRKGIKKAELPALSNLYYTSPPLSLKEVAKAYYDPVRNQVILAKLGDQESRKSKQQLIPLDLDNSTVRELAKILTDSRISENKRKEIEKQIISFVNWLREKTLADMTGPNANEN